MDKLPRFDHSMVHATCVADAQHIQQTLRDRVIASWDSRPIQTVAGVDVGAHASCANAAVVVLSYPELGFIESASIEAKVVFPYVPGYLGFRELPVILDALVRLSTVPDMVLVDGQGLAHPRRMGVASHLGVLLDLPTVGCAKSRLFGEHGQVAPNRGQRAPLADPETGEAVGAVLRTRTGVKPLYISIGHRVDLATAIEVILTCARTRIPEPLRLAHTLASHGDAALGAALARRSGR